MLCEDPAHPHEPLLLAKSLLLGKAESLEGLVAYLASLFGLAPASGAALTLHAQQLQGRQWSRVVVECQTKEALLAACCALNLRLG